MSPTPSKLTLVTHQYPDDPIWKEEFEDTDIGLNQAKIRLKQTVEEEMATWGRRKLTAFYISGRIEEKEFISVKRGDVVIFTASDPIVRAWILTPDSNSH